MRLLNRDTDYAVRALLRVAEKGGEKIPVSGLARELHIPYPFLRKIFQTLQKEGVVLSSKGKGGGFILAAPAAKVALSRLIEIFQGPLELSHCLYGEELCTDIRTCPLRGRILALEKGLLRDVRSITLQTLLNEKRKHDE